MTTLWTEDWTGSDGASWPARWTHSHSSGASADIQSNQGRQLSGSSSGLGAKSIATGETAVADCDVVVKFTAANPRVGEYPAVAVRSSSGFTGGFPTSCYNVELWINNNIAVVSKQVSGSSTQLGSDIAHTFVGGGVYWVRFQAIGTAIKCRIWNDGSSEPGTWDLQATDSAVTGTGYVALMTNTDGSQHPILWDQMLVTDNGTASSGGVFLPKIIVY